MSYSFTVTAESKADAKQKVSDEFVNVVAAQPPHAKDRDAAVAAAGAFIDLLADPTDAQQVMVSVHGSLGWNHDAPDSFTGAGVGVSASVRAKA